MVDKDRVRLMTDLAVYEKHHDQDVFKITKYFRSDYIFWNTILSGARYTLAFVIVLAAYVLLKSDIFFYNINFNGYYAVFKKCFYYYLVGLFIYSAISVLCYRYRYKMARRGMLFYATKLKRLSKKNTPKKRNT